MNYISIRQLFKKKILEPSFPPSTTPFFVPLHSEAFKKSCFYPLSLLSHFRSSFIIIIIIGAIIVTMYRSYCYKISICLFRGHRGKELHYSRASTATVIVSVNPPRAHTLNRVLPKSLNMHYLSKTMAFLCVCVACTQAVRCRSSLTLGRRVHCQVPRH